MVVTAYEKELEEEAKTGVALLIPIIRAYFSHGRNCKNSRNCIYDCSSIDIGETESLENWDIGAVRLNSLMTFFDLDTC